MRVLTVYASKHGSTKAIAERIAERLREGGVEVDVVEPATAPAPRGYDAFVIGSAVYFGCWMKPVAAFVRDNSEVLSSHPTWLFSSGPVGDKELPPPKEVTEFATSVHPVDHAVLRGALGKQGLSFTERTMVKAVHAPYEDSRDWAVIDTWAHAIVGVLRQRMEVLSPLAS